MIWRCHCPPAKVRAAAALPAVSPEKEEVIHCLSTLKRQGSPETAK
jgi:hypothetical protein